MKPASTMMCAHRAATAVLRAREWHRKAQSLERWGYPVESIDLARALRNSSLRTARKSLLMARALGAAS